MINYSDKFCKFHIFLILLCLLSIFGMKLSNFWLIFSLTQLPSMNFQILWKLENILDPIIPKFFVIKFSDTLLLCKGSSYFSLVPIVAPVFLVHLLFWSFIWNFKAGRKAHSSLSMVLCQCYSCPFPCLWPLVCCLVPFSCHLYTNWQLSKTFIFKLSQVANCKPFRTDFWLFCLNWLTTFCI